MHSRFESAEDIVAAMIDADTIPVITAGAWWFVTAIIAVFALSGVSPSSSFIARAASPRMVGKIAIAAIKMADRKEAPTAVFSSLQLSKRLTISGPDRKVQK